MRPLLLGTPAHGGAPLARDARFELGSVTKALVGSLLAKMAAQGRIALRRPRPQGLPIGPVGREVVACGAALMNVDNAQIDRYIALSEQNLDICRGRIVLTSPPAQGADP